MKNAITKALLLRGDLTRLSNEGGIPLVVSLAIKALAHDAQVLEDALYELAEENNA